MEEQHLSGASEKNVANGEKPSEPNSTQMLTGVGEKDTRPVMAAISQLSVDVEDALHERSGRSSGRRPVLRFFRGYGSALIMGLPVLPIVVSAVTIGIYLSNPSAPGWVSVLYGVVFTYIGWWLISLLLVPLTSPRNANSHSYGLLESRLNQLETRLYAIRNDTPDEKQLPEYQQVALNEAFDKLEEITKDLYESDTRLPWATGYGYINTWDKLHRAEEALVEVEPVEMTMRGAMHDKMAIAGSQISNRDELLTKLRYAVNKLDPAMSSLFKPAASAAPSENENPDIQQLQQDVQQIAYHLLLDLDRDHPSTQPTKASHDAEDPARARLTLREVRRALNDYRDHLWEGLVRARNKLWGMIFITGLITYLLLCIAILSVSLASGRTTIIAAVAFYIVGAIAGLFGAISRESITDTHIDDYGLALTRLIFTPSLSGLAGVGGVLIASLLFETFFSRQGTISLQNIFQLNAPSYLIVSAFFGYLSNLVSGKLQARAGRYISASVSSKTANEEGVDQPPQYSASDRQLEQVFDHDLKQTRQWSRITAVTAIVGLLLILGGVITVLMWNILVGFVITIAGGVFETVAAFSLQKVRNANSLLDSSSESIREAKKNREGPSIISNELLKL